MCSGIGDTPSAKSSGEFFFPGWVTKQQGSKPLNSRHNCYGNLPCLFHFHSKNNFVGGVCVSIHTCAWTSSKSTCIQVHTHAEANVEVACLSKLLSSLLCEEGSLIEPGVHSFSEVGWPASLKELSPHPQILYGPRGSELNSHSS